MVQKKFLSSLLLNIMIVAVLAGCGGQAATPVAPAEGQTAVVPVTSGDWSTTKSAQEGGGMDTLVIPYNEHSQFVFRHGTPSPHCAFRAS